MRNLFLFLLFVFAAMGCGQKSERSENEILFWSSNNSYEIDFAKKMVDEWTVKHPDKKIIFQPVPEGQSSEEIILAAVVGKTTPDLYSNMWQGDVEVYAQAGALVPLDTLPGFMEFLYNRCDSDVVKEITSTDGHIYQVPWKINPVMMMYNEKLLEEIKVESVPTTYSDYLDASEKFKLDINGDGYVDRWMGYAEVTNTWWQRFFDFYPLYLAASNGGSLVRDGKAAFDNEAAISVFRFLSELYKNNYFPKERISVRSDIFLTSVVATRFTGPWDISHSEKYKPEGFRYGFSAMPVPDNHTGPVYTYGDPKNIVMFSTCKNPVLAWEFLKTVISEQGDFLLLKMVNQFPRRKDLTTNSLYSDYLKQNSKMEDFAKQAKYVKGTDISPVLKEVFDLISQEYESCVVYGVKTPEEAIHDAAKAVNLLLEKSK